MTATRSVASLPASIETGLGGHDEHPGSTGVAAASSFTPTASTSTTSTRARGSRSCCCTAGVVSTNPIWTGVPVAYASHMDTLAEHFRVIAPGHPRLRQDRALRRADQLRPARRRRRRADRRTRTRAASDRRLQRGRDHRDRSSESGTPTRSERSSTTPASTRSIPRRRRSR